MSEEKVKPETKFVAGGVSATIWKNVNKGKDGKEYEFFSVAIERSYKDTKEVWQKTSTFRLNDLPKVELVTAKAYEYLALKNLEE